MLRPALLILSGNIAASGFLFARNLAVAALIPVADYGVAATFALAMAAVEMASSFGLQQQIVQARDGDDPRLQDALAGFQLFRGVLAAGALFALAGPLATFLGIPEVTWAYRLLALVPLLNAMQHFDIHRMNRNARFGPLVAVNALPPLLSLAVVWPLAVWVGDWRVMLGAILSQAASGAVLSHLVAERPWKAVANRALWSRTLRFGWPILLNAVILFLVFQADKLAVGRILGMAPLGVFAMGVTLTLTPSLVAAKTIQTSNLAKLSAATEANFPIRAAHTITASMTAGLALAIMGGAGAWIAAPWLLMTDYAALAPLLGPMAILQGLRISKSGSNVVALSRGMTGNAIVSNLPRLVALIAGITALANGAELLALIWLGVAGEALGFAVSIVLVTHRIGLRWPMDRIALATAGFVASIAGLAFPALLFGAAAVLPMLILWRRNAV